MFKKVYNFLFLNWRAKVISLVIAFALFSYTQTLKYKIVTISVPVSYRNRPTSLQYIKTPTRFIKLKIKGSDENIKFPTSNLRAYVDLSDAQSGFSEYELSFSKKQIPDSVEIVQIPQIIKVGLDEKISKVVRIRIRVKGRVATGYKRGRIILDPGKVTLTGVKSNIANLSEVFTKEININGLSKNKIVNIALVLPLGVESNLKKVRAQIFVYAENVSNEKRIDEIKLLAQNLDPALKTAFSNDTVFITVQGDEKILRKLTSKDFSAYVDVESTIYNANTKRILPFANETGITVRVLSLKKISGINIVSVFPESISVRFSVKKEYLQPDSVEDIKPSLPNEEN